MPHNIDENAIYSMDSELYSTKKATNLFDWEQMFIYSVLLSYHLPYSIRERCNNFKVDYPELPYVEIDWPSFNEPGRMNKVQIVPEEKDWGIEFSFKQ